MVLVQPRIANLRYFIKYKKSYFIKQKINKSTDKNYTEYNIHLTVNYKVTFSEKRKKKKKER